MLKKIRNALLDYDYEEPKNEGKDGSKCAKGNRCGKAAKDSKDSKKEKGNLQFLFNTIVPESMYHKYYWYKSTRVKSN
jgi:hypothetical protein